MNDVNDARRADKGRKGVMADIQTASIATKSGHDEV